MHFWNSPQNHNSLLSSNLFKLLFKYKYSILLSIECAIILMKITITRNLLAVMNAQKAVLTNQKLRFLEIVWVFKIIKYWFNEPWSKLIRCVLSKNFSIFFIFQFVILYCQYWVTLFHNNILEKYGLFWLFVVLMVTVIIC